MGKVRAADRRGRIAGSARPAAFSRVFDLFGQNTGWQRKVYYPDIDADLRLFEQEADEWRKGRGPAESIVQYVGADALSDTTLSRCQRPSFESDGIGDIPGCIRSR